MEPCYTTKQLIIIELIKIGCGCGQLIVCGLLFYSSVIRDSDLLMIIMVTVVMDWN